MISIDTLLTNNALMFYSYSFLRFGFIGNHPFFTRWRCSKTSRILHRHEQPTTPSTGLSISLSVNSEATMKAMPEMRNTHQHFTPKWYSDLITIG